MRYRRPVLLRNATANWPVMHWWKKSHFTRLFNSTSFDVFVNELAVGGTRYSEKMDLFRCKGNSRYATCVVHVDVEAASVVSGDTDKYDDDADADDIRFLAHMEDVQSRLTSLGLDQQDAQSILKRYTDIGLPICLVMAAAAVVLYAAIQLMVAVVLIMQNRF